MAVAVGVVPSSGARFMFAVGRASGGKVRPSIASRLAACVRPCPAACFAGSATPAEPCARCGGVGIVYDHAAVRALAAELNEVERVCTLPMDGPHACPSVPSCESCAYLTPPRAEVRHG